MKKNTHNHYYSIRKFTMGTASILIGTGVYLGISHHAEAAEGDTPAPTISNSQTQAAPTAPQTAGAETPSTQTNPASTSQTNFKIGDYAWVDTDGDGIQGDTEQPLANLKIDLTQNGQTIASTTTDANGKYLFSNVANGTYELNYETPDGYTPTQVQAGEDATKDSNGGPAEVTINNSDDLSIDFGYLEDEPVPVAKYNMGDFVWNDLNQNGIQDKDEPGLKDVQVTLTNPDNTNLTTTTNEKGNYTFTDLPNGNYKIAFATPAGFVPTKTGQGDIDVDSNGVNADVLIQDANNAFVDSGFYQLPTSFKIGHLAWVDADQDGIQGDTELGLAHVKVDLTKDGKVVASTVTDSNGHYQFDNVNNGTYQVEFDVPEGYTPTQVQAGEDETKDSNGTPVEVTIDNADNLTIDMGYLKDTPTPVAVYELGDFVWNDLNENGIQDKDEPSLKDIQVTLTNPDNSTLTTVTDAKGNYKFSQIPNGKYKVAFTTPVGFVPTKTGQGEADNDSNGSVTEINISDANNDYVDSGFYKPVEKTPEVQPVTPELPNNTNQPLSEEDQTDYSSQLLEFTPTETTQNTQPSTDTKVPVSTPEAEVEDNTDYSTELLNQTNQVTEIEDNTDYSSQLLEFTPVTDSKAPVNTPETEVEDNTDYSTELLNQTNQVTEIEDNTDYSSQLLGFTPVSDSKAPVSTPETEAEDNTDYSTELLNQTNQVTEIEDNTDYSSQLLEFTPTPSTSVTTPVTVNKTSCDVADSKTKDLVGHVSSVLEPSYVSTPVTKAGQTGNTTELKKQKEPTKQKQTQTNIDKKVSISNKVGKTVHPKAGVDSSLTGKKADVSVNTKQTITAKSDSSNNKVQTNHVSKKKQEKKELPKTGESTLTSSIVLFGLSLAAVGSALLLKRRNSKN
ncbi:carboxypeptidase regulatory-like domain-containing protein [Staphylococcus sp. IVB6181]|uniref:SdrD B-like domain-containing protein n=1 Tax=Staphylococcus sp. IVB6181 TaxID=2929481 RepID=UPI0021CF46D3|nr:SdrD B-like domain-containing protein [Staphylococcus sp. IVB6181]UXV33956.1 carboxypeptidase regulatory-like domain-containing protein [Staphylococcus sp. IVB6181]